METLDEILVAFEEALELERELGTRTVECDRALLSPSGRVGSPILPSGAPGRVGSPSRPPDGVQTSLPVPASAPGGRLGEPPLPKPPLPKPPLPKLPLPKPPLPGAPLPVTSHQSPITKDQEPSKDFAFIAQQVPQGAAADLLRKVIAAMGYTMEQVTVVAAAEAVAAKPAARVYVVLGGSDAFRTFAPGQRAALGLWTEVNEVPTIVTYSPARILSYFGNDAEGLTKAKRQIWSDLKSALARIGKKPPR